MRLKSAVLGMAMPGLNRASVYYDRVFTKTAVGASIGTTLGDVIAHELAHLMLPPGHSRTGIMRRVIDTGSQRLPTFTPEEAFAIRFRVSSPGRTD